MSQLDLINPEMNICELGDCTTAFCTIVIDNSIYCKRHALSILAGSKIAALEAERDEWKKRAEQAAHIKEDDKVGFDWNVLAQIELLEAVAEAARTGKGLDDALDALKKEVSNE